MHNRIKLQAFGKVKFKVKSKHPDISKLQKTKTNVMMNLNNEKHTMSNITKNILEDIDQEIANTILTILSLYVYVLLVF